MDANHSQTSDPGLALVLFALVRSNPPATISFVDQSGQSVANTTDFLLLDSQTNPRLANHTLRIVLSSLSGNLSLNVSNSVGTVQSNLTLAGQPVRTALPTFYFSHSLYLRYLSSRCKILRVILFPEFLQSRVEVPMLGIVTGGAMAFMALLILSLIVLCLMQKNKSKSFGERVSVASPGPADANRWLLFLTE